VFTCTSTTTKHRVVQHPAAFCWLAPIHRIHYGEDENYYNWRLNTPEFLAHTYEVVYRPYLHPSFNSNYINYVVAMSGLKILFNHAMETLLY